MLSHSLAFLSGGLLALSWWQIVLATLVSTHITIVSVTVYLHRCQAHRALDLHPLASHFFRFWLWMTTGIVTGKWAAVHRKHHAKCETQEDPHSPQFKGIWKVLLGGAELYRTEAKNGETLRRFGHGTPVDWMERNVYEKYPDLGVSLLMVIDILLFGVVGVSVWAIQMMWIPFWAGGVVNGLGHFWGYRNFGPPDASTNVFPIGILIGGEELHNNHHAYATSAKMSNRWYEFDIGWMYICVLSALGLAKVRKVALRPHLVKGKSVLDDETLQAVLRNRCEVMASYARTAEHAYRQELVRAKHMSRRERAALMRGVRKWFRDGQPAQDGARQPVPTELCDNHAKLLVYVELREDLAAIWERSNRSREQLLCQLEAWCRRAEQSRIDALREFSLRLRHYG
ncbi:DesA family fatty acid desaturase [Paraburkholderia xenovorans]|uniref:Fatty acid desaturase n=1 Tax=Paraburkholderia xenovorans (strain LB400) TaxID=266265 RepID=Q13RD7_PARXL|nr:fatty acid desaturase [Paraburkholderia xenovorans]ABE33352.1 Fatty acid desaturase [Paraburkholderia xenovorans LB400]